MDTERVMERVRRLLAIANDPAASDNEQRIALEQAQRLMDRHAIEEWQLEVDWLQCIRQSDEGRMT